MNTTTVAVDLAKSVFELAVSNVQGRVTERKRLSREAFGKFFVNRRPCRVVMEACGTAHFWARTLQALGHKVKLLPPQHVRRNKTDWADAAVLPVPTAAATFCRCRSSPRASRRCSGDGARPAVVGGRGKQNPARPAQGPVRGDGGDRRTRHALETLEKQLREEARQCPAVQKLMRSPASGC